MADNFGLKIGLEGEKEFKKALSDINSSFKVLGSEMKLVESQFGKNDTSVSALTARITGGAARIKKRRLRILKYVFLWFIDFFRWAFLFAWKRAKVGGKPLRNIQLVYKAG